MPSSRGEQIVRARKAYEKSYNEALAREPANRMVISPFRELGVAKRNAWIKMVNDVYEQGRVDEQFSTE